MRRSDGNSFTEIPFTDGNNAVRDRCLGGAVYEQDGRRGTRQQYCRAQAMVIREGHLIMVWRRLMSGREFGMALVNKDLTCLLSRRQALYTAQQGRK